MSELTITDGRLKPIAEKVLAGVRLSGDEGIALYRTPDLLAVGWLAYYFMMRGELRPAGVTVAPSTALKET